MDDSGIIIEIFLGDDDAKGKTKTDIGKKEAPMCLAVANRIINRTNAHNRMRADLGQPIVSMNGKRLQKILYLCQLEWIAEGHRDYLISDDFEAWVKGPVVASIYNVFSIYQDGGMLPYRSKDIKGLSEEERRIINYVVDSTIDIDTDTIVAFTHTPGGPWDQAYNNRDNEGRWPVIPKETIRRYMNSERNKEYLQMFLKEGVLPDECQG